jgi:hypothetical protein
MTERVYLMTERALRGRATWARWSTLLLLHSMPLSRTLPLHGDATIFGAKMTRTKSPPTYLRTHLRSHLRPHFRLHTVFAPTYSRPPLP